MTEIKMVTEKGDLNIQLFDENAPKTIASFLYLAKQGFYN
ncbi:MAG: hypothetical protein GF311_27190 [Candidatus Lokiarchaeota archaeon]|nr:peptidylprolyl isomerase [Candidatus Lokiarchaeota archaeon]MBD3216329.1 hypothetical protein [Candidatus Lokiarchaeota archaeon]